MSLRNGVGVVVHVTAAVGPIDIVERNHRREAIIRERCCLDHHQFVVHGEPVVIAFDEDNIDIVYVLEDVEASSSVKHEALTVSRWPLVDIDLREWVNGVQHRPEGRTVLEHLLGQESTGDPDLDDPLSPSSREELPKN